MTKRYAIGIDLGTTNSCVGIWKNNHVEIIENNLGSRKTPSYVAFNNNELMVGETALHKIGMNPENTIFGIKRLMGRIIDDENIQSNMKFYPFKIYENRGKPLIPMKYKNEKMHFIPEEISAMILSKMKETAEDYLGHSVTDAVITVPAYFNDSQRRATIDAGKIAGLNVLQIINEPTAAAMTYYFNNKNKILGKKENILIIDLGGGTYDVSLMTINNGNIEVKATAGDTHFGGEDFNNRLIEYFIKKIKEKYKKDISSNRKSFVRLRRACEKAKCVLSSFEDAPIEVEYLFEEIDFKSQITRSRFEELCSDLFEKIIEPIKIVLKNSNLLKTDINEIILVGGSTRIPKVQEIISNYFDGKKINKTINIEEAVTYGAAIQASILSGEISEQTNKINFKDIIPYSLGIPNNKGNFDILINCNTNIPGKVIKSYYVNSCSHQYPILFDIYEINHIQKKDIKLLDEYKIISNIWYKTKIDVIFEIDKNGILHVLLINENFNLEYYCYTERLYNDNIYQMIQNFEKLKEENKKLKEKTESMNNLEKYAYDLRSLLRDDRKVKKLIYNYINNLKKDVDSTIEWVKNNQNANTEEFDTMKLKLERKIKPLYEKNSN
eukprot:jgi/Orpsp1_1/1186431/evm.model.d7180000050548.1